MRLSRMYQAPLFSFGFNIFISKELFYFATKAGYTGSMLAHDVCYLIYMTSNIAIGYRNLHNVLSVTMYIQIHITNLISNQDDC